MRLFTFNSDQSLVKLSVLEFINTIYLLTIQELRKFLVDVGQFYKFANVCDDVAHLEERRLVIERLLVQCSNWPFRRCILGKDTSR